MKLWIVAVATFLVLLGVLEVAPLVGVDVTAQNVPTLPAATSALLGIIAVTLFGLSQVIKHQVSHRLLLLLQCLSAGFMLFAFAHKGLYVSQQAYQQQFKHPLNQASIRVIASVRALGVNDRAYDPSEPSYYRQLAVIEHIQPLQQSNYQAALKAYRLHTQNIELLRSQSTQSNGSQPNNSQYQPNSSQPNSSQYQSSRKSNQAHFDGTHARVANPFYNTQTQSIGHVGSAESGNVHSNTKHAHHQEDTLQPLVNKRVLLNAYAGLHTTSKIPSKIPSKITGDKTDSLMALNQLAPNQNSTLILELSSIPPIDTTDAGFNQHRWLRSRHVVAQAKVLAVDADDMYDMHHINATQSLNMPNQQTISTWQNRLNDWRWQLRQHFLQDWHNKTLAQQQADAVSLSLLTGDRGLIDKSTKHLYQLAGISHLLAISGTHVLFLAIVMSSLCMAMVNRFGYRLYHYLPRWQLRWLIMVSVAAIYAAFTGFDVPAARTLYMLIAVGMARLLLLPLSAQKVLLLVALLMAWHDPFVIWQPGFWLSFVAVMLLIVYEQGSINKQSLNKQATQLNQLPDDFVNPLQLPYGWLKWLIGVLYKMLKLQLWMFVTLLPITLLLFGEVSVWGLPINLLTIGIYGWVIVPVNLCAGVLYPFAPFLSDVLWHLVSQLLSSIHHLLAWALTEQHSGFDPWLYTQMNASILLMALLVILPWSLPKGLMHRLLSVPPLGILALMLHNGNPQTATQPSLTILTSPNHVSALLLRQEHTAWLILADYQANSEDNRNNKRKNPQGNAIAGLDSKNKTHVNKQAAKIEKMTKSWQKQLDKLSIEQLTGVIIQSPSPLLLAAYQSLQPSHPSTMLWSAYSDKQLEALTNHELNHLSNDKLATNLTHHKTCQTGLSWSDASQTLRIKAVTGWQQIDNVNMHHCALQLQSSKQPITLRSLHQVAWASSDNRQTHGQQLANQQKMVGSGLLTHSASTALPTAQTVIVDAATDTHLWQVWEMMCKQDAIKIANTIAATIADNNLDTQRVMISHSQSAAPTNLMQKWQADTLVLTDKHTGYNQQKVTNRLLDFLPTSTNN